MDDILVKFNNSLTQAAYDALATKDSGTLYYTTDSKRLYKGNEIYGDDVVVLSTLPTTGFTNKLYIVSDGVKLNSYIWDGVAFKQIGAAPLASVLTDVDFIEATQLFTFSFADGSTKKIDLVLESVIKDIEYDRIAAILTITLVNGNKTDISLMDLIDAYEGAETTSTKTEVLDGVIKVNVKVSDTPGNQLTVDSKGLFVAAYDSSSKMDKVTGAANGNIGTLNTAGQTIDSKKKFTTTIRAIGTADDNSIPTEKSVRMAVDTAITWQ